MPTTRIDGDKMRRAVKKAINPFGALDSLEISAIRGIVIVNGREEVFEIQALEIETRPIVKPGGLAGHDLSGRTMPAGKLRIAAVDGVAL